MKNTGPTKTKVNEDGGPNGAKFKELWDKIFHSKEQCRYNWDGMCVLKIQERTVFPTGRKEDPSDYECEMCSRFEKGENPTRHLRKLRRLSKLVYQNFQRRSQEEV